MPVVSPNELVLNDHATLVPGRRGDDVGGIATDAHFGLGIL